jgi:hypothetical protein
MVELPIGECALSGPRFILRKPGVVAAWMAIQILINLIGSVAMIAVMGGPLQSLMRASRDKADPQATLAAFAALAPAYLVSILISLVIYAVIYGAMNRAVLRPDEGRFAYLRLGGDEFRQGVLMVAFGFMGLLVYIAAVLVGVILAGIIGVVAGVMNAPFVSVIMMVLLFVGIFALYAFLGVRVSLASAITFDTRRIDLFGGWSMSRGRFWPMFAIYLLAGLMAAALVVVGGLLVWSAVAATAPGQSIVQFMAQPNLGTVSSYFTPARVIYVLVFGALSTLMLPILLMPGATIYRHLAPSASAAAGGQSMDEVFA